MKHPKLVPFKTELPPPASPSYPGWVGASRLRSSTLANSFDNERPTRRCTPVTVTVPTHATPSDRALLTMLGGPNAGQVFPLEREETFLGCGDDADVCIEEVGVSRRHARILRTNTGRYVLEDLGSTNGVFVNGRRVDRFDLCDGDRLQIGAALVMRFGLIAADEEALAQQLYEGSTRDALTNSYNRNYAGERLATEVAYAHRHNSLFNLVLFDLDHFKRINDSSGHLAGDVVLRIVAAQVQKLIRMEDVLARWGGEEFVVLARGIDRFAARSLANRVRKGIERLSIPWESGAIKTSASVGVASLSECGPSGTVEALVAIADGRLYAAKAGGRNRVC